MRTAGGCGGGSDDDDDVCGNLPLCTSWHWTVRTAGGGGGGDDDGGGGGDDDDDDVSVYRNRLLCTSWPC